MSDTTLQLKTGAVKVRAAQNDRRFNGVLPTATETAETRFPSRKVADKSWRETFAFPAYSGLLDIV